MSESSQKPGPTTTVESTAETSTPPAETTEIATLQAQLEEAQQKAADYWDRLVRTQAEMKNIEQRNQREIQKVKQFSVESFAQDLVHVLDSFDQALHLVDNETVEVSVSDLCEGMTLTQRALLQTLEKHGIQIVSAQPGDRFDPALHEAIAMADSTEYPANTLVNIIQKGYQIHQRLLRPARVVVARAQSTD